MVIAEPCIPNEGISKSNANVDFRCTSWNATKITGHIAPAVGEKPPYFDKFTVITDDGTTYIFEAVCWSYTEERHYTMNYFDPPEGPNEYLQDPHIYLQHFWDNPTASNYDPPWQNETLTYHEGVNAPYFWGLTRILSPDYIDRGAIGCDDADYGSWIKLDYEYPVNTGQSEPGYFNCETQKSTVLAYETRYQLMQSKVFGSNTAMNETDTIKYNYNINNTDVPTNREGLVLDYNPYYYEGYYGDQVYRIIYAPGWARLNSITTTVDGVRSKKDFTYDNTESDYTIPDLQSPPYGALQLEHDNGIRTKPGNGRVETVINYIGVDIGTAVSRITNIDNSIPKEFITNLKDRLKASIYTSPSEGKAGIENGESLSSFIGNVFANVKHDVVGWLFSKDFKWDKISHKRFIYAYDTSSVNHTDPNNSIYSEMKNRNMLSSMHRIKTYNQDITKIGDNRILYSKNPSNNRQILPSESQQLLTFRGGNRFITSTFDEYDVYGNLTHVTDPLGRETTAVYDYAKNSLPSSITNANNFTTEIEYDDRLLAITKIIDPNDMETRYFYDNFGRLSKIYYPNNPYTVGGSSNPPSVEYGYHWTNRGPDDFLTDGNSPEDFLYLQTKTLVSTITGEKRVATSFFDGLGQGFRSILQTGDYFTDGVYSDVFSYKTGETHKSYVAYESDSWNDALQTPLGSYTTGDNRYIPFTKYYMKRTKKLSGGSYVVTADSKRRIDAIFHPMPEENIENFVYGGSSDIIEFSAIFDNGSVGSSGMERYTKTIDGEGRCVEERYDGAGNLIERIEGLAVENIRWETGGGGGYPTYITGKILWDDFSGQSFEPISNTYYNYDALGRLVTVKDASREESERPNHHFSYDSFGRLRKASDPDRGITEYGYDDIGNLTRFQDPVLAESSESVYFYYDQLNRITKKSIDSIRLPGTAGEERGTGFSADMDLFGAQVGLFNSSKVSIPGGFLTGIPDDCGIDGHFSYLNGLSEGELAKYTYDEFPSSENKGNEEGDKENGGGLIADEGDEYLKGKLVQVEDKIGKKRLYYDNMGRVTKIEEDRCYFDNQEFTHEYEYNTIGDLTSEIYPSGLEISYEFDTAGRLINIPGVYGSTSGSSTYENEEPMGGGSFSSFGANPSGLANRNLPSLIERDKTRRGDKLLEDELSYRGISPTMDQVFDGFEYDDFGRMYKMNPINSVYTEFDFNDNLLVDNLDIHLLDRTVRYEFGYDESLQVTSITDNLFPKEIDGHSYERERQFEYDNFNRLKGYVENWKQMPVGPKGNDFVTVGGAKSGLFGGVQGKDMSVPVRDIRYNYDILGNRLSIVDNLISDIQTYSYKTNNNQMLTDHEGYEYEYDARGTVVSRDNPTTHDYFDYYHDYAGRLIKIENRVGALINPGPPDGPSRDDENGKDNRDNSKIRDDSKGKGSEDKARTGKGVPLSESGDDSIENKDNQEHETDEMFPDFVWEFTYDGGGARIAKRGPNSASKYSYDASGRLITEFTNDVTKSSANILKNAGFEVFEEVPSESKDETQKPDKDNPDGDKDVGEDSKDGLEDDKELTAKGENSEELNDNEEEGSGLILGESTLARFQEWEKNVVGPGKTIRAYDYGENDGEGLEGRIALELNRTTIGGDLEVEQLLELKPNRTYELRFWSKWSDGSFGGDEGAYAGVRLNEAVIGIPPDYAEARLDGLTNDEWTEYRIPFNVGTDAEVLIQLGVSDTDTGVALFDRVTVCEFLNDVATNSSFEIYNIPFHSGNPDFVDWEESPQSSEDHIDVGDGLLTDSAVRFVHSGSLAYNYVQRNVFDSNSIETYEISFYSRLESGGAEIADSVLCESVWVGTNQSIELEAVETVGDDGWVKFKGYYTTPGSSIWNNTVFGIRLGSTGGACVLDIDDVCIKVVPDIIAGGDMETYIEIPGQFFPGSPTYDFTGWEEDTSDTGNIIPEETEMYMNDTGVKLIRDEGAVALPAIKPITMSQEIPCLPDTEYEIIIAYRTNSQFRVATEGEYGAFCLVGEEIVPSGMSGPGDFWEYNGTYDTVFNDMETVGGGGSVEWTTVRTTYRSTGDKIDVLFGLGQGTVGSCDFDAVIIRDLTTRRMEYVYAGRKLAKVEYEGDIDEAQVYYYHHDGNGSPILMTDTDGEEVWKGDYMPFGEDITEQVDWGNAYTFLGNEDDGGLSFFNARYYSPELGRFMSCDPIKLMGSTLSINPYVYSYNNPISYSDASGLAAQDIPKKNGGSNISDETAEGKDDWWSQVDENTISITAEDPMDSIVFEDMSVQISDPTPILKWGKTKFDYMKIAGKTAWDAAPKGDFTKNTGVGFGRYLDINASWFAGGGLQFNSATNPKAIYDTMKGDDSRLLDTFRVFVTPYGNLSNNTSVSISYGNLICVFEDENLKNFADGTFGLSANFQYGIAVPIAWIPKVGIIEVGTGYQFEIGTGDKSGYITWGRFFAIGKNLNFLAGSVQLGTTIEMDANEAKNNGVSVPFGNWRESTGVGPFNQYYIIIFNPREKRWME